MRVSNRFFAAIFIGMLIGFAIFWSLVRLQLGVPTESSRWCYDILNRKKQLCRAIKGKKLVLVGGSNVLFGLRAHEIEEATGVPTINYGLNAALTGPYLIDLSKEVLNPGDTVLLALEYSGYESMAQDQLFIDYVMSRDPARFEQAPWLTRLKWGFGFSVGELIHRYNTRKKAVAPHTINFPYDVTYLNGNGDQSGHTADKKPADRKKVYDVQGVLGYRLSETSYEVQSIRSFCAWAAKNNIRVLATFPNVVQRPEFDTPVAAQTIREIENLYKSMNVPVVGSARESMLPDTEFFDTRYHLTEEAAKVRTAKLLVHLAPYLKN
ncbi:MAG: hypothetical protein JWM68_5496 [Verrucomicrobiales bacterium]|nr:hypothetical protein [Verrucomicrobiales bacterium]